MKNIMRISALLIALAGISNSVSAEVTIKDVSIKKAKNGHAVIKLKGDLSETPELSIRDRMVQVAIPNSTVWPKIEKKATLGAKSFDTTLLAYQYDKKTARFRIMLPYSLKGKEDQVSLTLRNGKIDVYFPKLKTKKAKGRSIALAKPAHRKKIPTKNIAKYDESYLEKLLKDKTIVAKPMKKAVAPQKRDIAAKEEKKEDRVNMAFSGNDKKADNGFSIAGYVGKFVAFLGLVLVLFMGVIQLFKKGVFKKGKLGFLTNTSSVEVLSTTFMGPKRSLVMVRAHKQVFLLGSSEKGIDFLSEIDDVSGLFKEGEKELSGNNFDTSLVDADAEDKEFRLKEDPTNEKAGEDSLSKLLDEEPTEDKVRFSDQIKSKVKNLKSLQ